MDQQILFWKYSYMPHIFVYQCFKTFIICIHLGFSSKRIVSRVAKFRQGMKTASLLSTQEKACFSWTRFDWPFIKLYCGQGCWHNFCRQSRSIVSLLKFIRWKYYNINLLNYLCDEFWFAIHLYKSLYIYMCHSHLNLRNPTEMWTLVSLKKKWTVNFSSFWKTNWTM